MYHKINIQYHGANIIDKQNDSQSWIDDNYFNIDDLDTVKRIAKRNRNYSLRCFICVCVRVIVLFFVAFKGNK